MGILSNTILSGAEALNPIRAGIKQASSYVRGPAKMGIRMARAVTKNALNNGMTYYAAGGAVAGGLAGAGSAYNNGSNRRGMISSTLKGAAIGAAGGAAIRMGMSGYGMRNGFTARGIGAGIGRGRQTVSNAYRMRMGMAKMERMAGTASSISSVMATAAGRAVGATRGAATWAKGMANRDSMNMMVDKAKYYAGL